MNETTLTRPRLSAPPNDEEDQNGGSCVAGKVFSRGRVSPVSSEEELGASSPSDDDDFVASSDHLTITVATTADDGGEAGSERVRRPSAGSNNGGDAASLPSMGDIILPDPRLDDAGGKVKAARATDDAASFPPASVASGGFDQPKRRQVEEKQSADFASAALVDGGGDDDDRLTSFLAASDGFQLGDVARRRNVQSTDDAEDGMEGEETFPFLQGADVAASALARGAELFRTGLEGSVVPRISSALDAAGGLAKAGVGAAPPAGTVEATPVDLFEPPTDEEPGEGQGRERRRSDRDLVVARVYADAARRASGGVLRASRCVALGACDAATGAIRAAKRKIAEDDGGRIGKMMVPDQQDREILAASGRVALAGLGAAAVVAESLYDATRAIARKGAAVTADVVQHKYGDDTRDIVEGTSEALGNTIEAVTFVHMMEAAALTKAIARNTGKESIKHDMDRGT